MIFFMKSPEQVRSLWLSKESICYTISLQQFADGIIIVIEISSSHFSLSLSLPRSPAPKEISPIYCGFPQRFTSSCVSVCTPPNRHQRALYSVYIIWILPLTQNEINTRATYSFRPCIWSYYIQDQHFLCTTKRSSHRHGARARYAVVRNRGYCSPPSILFHPAKRHTINVTERRMNKKA